MFATVGVGVVFGLVGFVALGVAFGLPLLVVDAGVGLGLGLVGVSFCLCELLDDAVFPLAAAGVGFGLVAAGVAFGFTGTGVTLELLVVVEAGVGFG